MAGAGLSPLLYAIGFILPHGIVELPVIWLAGSAILRWGSCLLARPDGHSIGELWIRAMGDFLVVLFGVVAPLALLSAALETWLTPVAAAWAMGVAGW
jgi:uncharacterized membrane protein SpoIIM required for sporulation